jgi:hypothetical protein
MGPRKHLWSFFGYFLLKMGMGEWRCYFLIQLHHYDYEVRIFTSCVNEGGKGPKKNSASFLVMWLPNVSLTNMHVWCVFICEYVLHVLHVCLWWLHEARVFLCLHFFCIPPSQGSPKPHSVEDECSKRPRCSVHIFLHNASFKRNEKFTPIVKL